MVKLCSRGALKLIPRPVRALVPRNTILDAGWTRTAAIILSRVHPRRVSTAQLSKEFARGALLDQSYLPVFIEA